MIWEHIITRKAAKGGTEKDEKATIWSLMPRIVFLAMTSTFIYKSRKLASDKWENQLIITIREAAVRSENSSQTSTQEMNAMASPFQIAWSKYLSCTSFTGNFGVKAAQTDGKCLKSRDWILVIHRENILSNFSKLKNDVFMLRSIL